MQTRSDAAVPSVAGRPNSSDDLAADFLASPPVHSPSDARLLYREWRTGSHVGGDLALLEPGALSHRSAMNSEELLSRSPFGVYGRSPTSLPCIAERLENLPERTNGTPASAVLVPQNADTSARLLSQKLAAMDVTQSGHAIKSQSGSYNSAVSTDGASGIKKAQSYQGLADLEKQGYFPVAPKPSALGVQRGLKDSVVNDMCRAVVKHMVGDVYVSASGSYGQRKVLNHLYEPVFASVQAHFRRLPARYALSVNPDDVPLHMRLLAQNQRDPTAIAVNAQLKKDDNGEIVPNVCEVVVVSLDRDNILDAIARALTTMKGNILDADVMTTADGTLLDRFVVKGSFMSDERQEELRLHIEQNLRRLSMDEEDTRPSVSSALDSSGNETCLVAGHSRCCESRGFIRQQSGSGRSAVK
uniref:ACT domain-containing protein n=1 Tax=Hyaloperonospora arabidopsidis (strain Emoy2) TaxID=559515 RepID=M4BAK6_HYAAE